jgi:exopolysaccharide biosynthesis polyprenyl glycosylphosphotransferase
MRRLFYQPQQRYRLLLLSGDILILLFLFLIIYYIDNSFIFRISYYQYNIFLSLFVIIIITINIFYILDLYDLSRPRGAAFILLTICLGLGIALLIYSSFAYFIIMLRPGKINLLIFFALAALLTFTWRWIYVRLIPIKPQHLLLLGNDNIFQDISQEIEKNYAPYYKIAGHWHRSSHNPTLPKLNDFVKENHIDTIVYSVHSQVVNKIANDLIAVGLDDRNIIDAYTFYQFLTRKYPIYFLDDFWLLITAQRKLFFPSVATRMKRLFDVLFVLVLMPLALPLMLLISLAIKATSAGPALFIQERLGQREVPFKLYKFRTMVHNAEALSGPVWSSDRDPRITKVGRILRKLRLDELPQLFNVLKGEMSVVGPRPIRKHFADILAQEVPYYRLRFLAKPGLTGWAQVNHDYAGSNDGQAKKLQYDLFYLVHQSLGLDLLILFKTVKIMIRGKGM